MLLLGIRVPRYIIAPKTQCEQCDPTVEIHIDTLKYPPTPEILMVV
jgi:hypothetical protein